MLGVPMAGDARLELRICVRGAEALHHRVETIGQLAGGAHARRLFLAGVVDELAELDGDVRRQLQHRAGARIMMVIISAL